MKTKLASWFVYEPLGSSVKTVTSSESAPALGQHQISWPGKLSSRSRTAVTRIRKCLGNCLSSQMCPQTTSLSFPFSSVLSNHKLKPKQEHKADRILTHNTFGLRLCVSSFYGIFMRYYLITLETPNNHPWRRPTFYKYLFVFIYLSVLGLSCGSQIFSYGMWDLVSCVCVCVCVGSDTQSCPTLCNPMDCSLPNLSVLGILQARILEWVAIPFSRGSSIPRDPTWVSCISSNGRQILYHYWHLRSPYLPDRALKPRPLHWEHGVLATGPPGKCEDWYLEHYLSDFFHLPVWVILFHIIKYTYWANSKHSTIFSL